MLSFNISSWRGPGEVHVMFGNTCLVGPKLSGLLSLLCTHENMLFSRGWRYIYALWFSGRRRRRSLNDILPIWLSNNKYPAMFYTFPVYIILFSLWMNVRRYFYDFEIQVSAFCCSSRGPFFCIIIFILYSYPSPVRRQGEDFLFKLHSTNN